MTVLTGTTTESLIFNSPDLSYRSYPTGKFPNIKPHPGPDGYVAQKTAEDRAHSGFVISTNPCPSSPNMHVLFDMGAIALADDLSILGMEGNLEIKSKHEISVDHIRYHREHIYKGWG